METENEDLIVSKRRKTEATEYEATNDNVVDDCISSDNYESFLQEYLKKRPQSDLPMFQRVIKHEEVEAKERNPEEDLMLYRDACADFADCVMDIAEIKATKPEGWKDRINEIRKEAAFITLIMKKLNRVEKTRTKISREKVNKERHQVDAAQLKLDNLLCEIQHLRREIDKCLKFKSRPLGIDLVSVQEFYEKSPLSVSKPEVTKIDDHQLQLARLEWEFTQRKELASLLNDLENKKSHITEQIEKKEKDLNSLAPLIKEVLVVTQPLQDKLGLSPFKTVSINDYASLLPEPLYFLYIQVLSYKDACDKGISVDIKGDISEARRVKCHNFQDAKTSDGDSDLVDDSNADKKKKNLDTEKQKLLSKHPLSVNLKISFKDGSKLDLQFFYLMKLHVLTVVPSLNMTSFSPSFTQELLIQGSLLSNLFNGDTGTESPNLKNFYQLKKVGLDNSIFPKCGIPYVWVQRMGGLNFISLNSKVEPKQDISRTNMPIIIKELKRRIQYRLSLNSLMTHFERGDILAPKEMQSIKLSCTLHSWKSLSSQEAENSSLGHIKDNSIMFFNGVITNGEVKLNFNVAVKADYPLSPSVFFLQMEWDNKTWNSANNPRILEIEREVNFYWKELLTSRTEATSLLSFQIFKIMVCFDILLQSLNPEKYSANKNFLHLHRGRNRCLPFKFLPEESLFVQRC